MKRSGPKNIVASIQARLIDRSRELGVEHQLTLARFGGERLLYPYLEPEDLSEALAYAAWRAREVDVEIGGP